MRGCRARRKGGEEGRGRRADRRVGVRDSEEGQGGRARRNDERSGGVWMRDGKERREGVMGGRAGAGVGVETFSQPATLIHFAAA